MTDNTSEAAEEPPRKGRSNAILTYETVEDIKLDIQKVDLKLDHLSADVSSQGKRYDDHEVRIRALELTVAGANASRGMGSWLFNSVWPVAAVLIALLSYLKDTTP